MDTDYTSVKTSVFGKHCFRHFIYYNNIEVQHLIPRLREKHDFASLPPINLKVGIFATVMKRSLELHGEDDEDEFEKYSVAIERQAADINRHHSTTLQCHSLR